jgi:hypothetical protein
MDVKSSIIANTGGGGAACGEIASGTPAQLLNKDDDGTCSGGGDLSCFDLALADNGGPTQTHALLECSNAIDHAGQCLDNQDQRGFPRNPNLCDSGAYELGCEAPDGDTLLLENDTVTGVESFEVCTTITAQNNYTVMGPNGDLTLRAGTSVILGDGFSVTVDGKLTVEIDPGSQMPISTQASSCLTPLETRLTHPLDVVAADLSELEAQDLGRPAWSIVECDGFLNRPTSAPGRRGNYD